MPVCNLVDRYWPIGRYLYQAFQCTGLQAIFIEKYLKRLAGLFLHARYSEKVAIVIVKRYLEIINSFTDIYSR